MKKILNWLFKRNTYSWEVYHFPFYAYDAEKQTNKQDI